MSTKAQALVMLGAAGLAGGIVSVGQVGVATASVGIAGSVADFGYAQNVSRVIATGHARRSFYNTAIKGMAARAALAMAIAGFIAFCLIRLNRLPLDPAVVVAYGVWAFAASMTLSLTQLMYAVGEYGRVNLLSSIFRTVGLGGFAVSASYGLSALLLTAALVEFCVTLIVTGSAIRRGRSLADSDAGISVVPSQKYAWLGLASLVNNLINRGDSLFVGLLLSPVQLGIYAVISQVQNAISTIAIAPSASVVPHIADVSERQKSSPDDLLRRASAIVWGLGALLAFCACLGLTLFPAARRIFDLGDLSGQITACLIIGCIAPPFSAAAGVFGGGITGLGENRLTATVWILLGAITVPLFSILSFGFSLIGAVLASTSRDMIFLILARKGWSRAMRLWLSRQGNALNVHGSPVQ